MALHIHKPNKMRKSERNIINTSIGKPQHEYKESKPKQPIHYSNIRTDKRLICKIKALSSTLGDKTVADTFKRILKVSIPKFIKSNTQKTLFKAEYERWMNRIK